MHDAVDLDEVSNLKIIETEGSFAILKYGSGGQDNFRLECMLRLPRDIRGYGAAESAEPGATAETADAWRCG